MRKDKGEREVEKVKVRRRKGDYNERMSQYMKAKEGLERDID